jgi:MFS family permease
MPPSTASTAARPCARAGTREFLLALSLGITFTAGSTAPTTLYHLYQARWGFSAVTLMAIFSAYLLVLLAGLMTLGRLSDHVGRKPVIVACTLVQLASMAVFVAADGAGGLVLARALQGLAMGGAMGALGAAMIDVDRDWGTVANAVSPAAGMALGGLAAGLMVHFLPRPTELVYEALGLLLLLQLAAAVLMREPGERRPGAWVSLRPQVTAPRGARGALLAAVPILIAGWAFVAFYCSLGPALVRHAFGLDAPLFGGAAVFVLSTASGLATLALRKAAPQAVMQGGALALAASAAAFMVSLPARSAPLFFTATALAGAGFGPAFQGAVRNVVDSVPAAQRAGVLSVLMVVSYLSMALPSLAAGLWVARTGQLQAAATAEGLMVVVLCGAALVAGRARQRPGR